MHNRAAPLRSRRELADADAATAGAGLRLPAPADSPLSAPVVELDRLTRGRWLPADAGAAPAGGIVLRSPDGRALGRLVIDIDSAWWLPEADGAATAQRAVLERRDAQALRLRLAAPEAASTPR